MIDLTEQIASIPTQRDDYEAPVQNGGNDIPTGKRKTSLVSMAGKLRRLGFNEGEMLGALKAINLNRCKPPLDIEEVEDVAQSVAKYPAGATEGLSGPLDRINGADLIRQFAAPREDVVRGLIRRRDVANIIGGPKTRKSFLAMELGLSVASGTPFLGFDTMKGRVLVIDNELSRDDLANRLQRMASAMGVDALKGIDVMPLRGRLADLRHIRDELCGLDKGTYSLCIVDALYKAMVPKTDENSNSDMTALYVMLDEIAEQQGCATAIIHHTSKGSQAQKSVSDMGSGAGAQSRSADAHIVLREHEEPDTVVFNAILRSQKPIEGFCMKFDYPLWHLAPDKSPAKIAVTNKKPTPTMAQFVEAIPFEPAKKKTVLAEAKAKLATSKTVMELLEAEALKRGLIEVVKAKVRTHPDLIRRLPESLGIGA